MSLIGIAVGGGLSTVVEADRFLWVGIDYTQVQMVGPDFSDADAIFPGHTDQWNARAASVESLSYLSSSLGAPVKPRVGHLEEAHAAVDGDALTSGGAGGAHLVSELVLSRAVVAERVASYDLGSESGVGLVFIMESMLKEAETGCMRAVFFDVEEREVLHMARYCEVARGVTFSTHWQTPVEGAYNSLKKDMKKWKKASKKAKEQF